MSKSSPKVNSTCTNALRVFQKWSLEELQRWQRDFPESPAFAEACYQAVVGRGLYGKRHQDGVVIGITPLAHLGNCTPGAIRKVLAKVQAESHGYGYGEGFHEVSPANKRAGREAQWYICPLAPLPEGIGALLGGGNAEFLFKRPTRKMVRFKFLGNLKRALRRLLNSSGTLTSMSFPQTTSSEKTMTMVDGDGLGEEGLEKKRPALTEVQEDLKARLMAEPCNLDCGGATEAARAVLPEEILPLLAAPDAWWAAEVESARRDARPRRVVSEADRHKSLLMARVRTPGLRRELIQRAKKALRGNEIPVGAPGDYAMATAIKTWRERVDAIPAEDHNARQGYVDAADQAWAVVERAYAETNPRAWEDLEAQVAAEAAERGGTEAMQKRIRGNFRRKRLTPLVEAIETRLTEAV